MIAKASEKYLRISPSKVQPVIDLIRGKGVTEALPILDNLNKKAARIVKKALNSAVANAKYKTETENIESELYISYIVANQGPMYKRYKPAAMGRAVMVRKRTTHLDIYLDRR